MLLTIGAFIFVIGVLIFVHELGHFVAAKAVGIGVPRFSIGLGPRTPLSFRRGETEYVISWIPFGGYVKMASKEEQEEAGAGLEGGALAQEFPPEKLFENKPLWARVMVISAGVAMNFLFAWVVYFVFATTIGRVEDPTTRVARVDAWFVPPPASELLELPENAQIVRINGDTVGSWNDVFESVVDLTSDQLRFEFAEADPVTVEIDGFAVDQRVAVYRSLKPLHEARIGSVENGTAAAEAGFEVGDVVISVNHEPIRHWEIIVQVVERSEGVTLEFEVLRDGERVKITAVPGSTTHSNPATAEERKDGYQGMDAYVWTGGCGEGVGGGVGVEGLAEGELAECDLTLRDITTITASLKQTLRGVYHPRIAYPEPSERERGARLGRFRPGRRMPPLPEAPAPYRSRPPSG